MTTNEALLANILANPNDDLPRLVLADWLEENGQAERAEFIRVSVWGDGAPKRAGTEDVSYRQWQQWRTRERELLEKHHREFFLPPSGFSPTTMTTSGPQDGSLCWIASNEPGVLINFTVRRGFVAEIHCRLADWCGVECRRCRGDGHFLHWDMASDTTRRGHDCPACSGTGRTPGIGPRLVREHPVERVVLTDREPLPVHLSGGYRPPSWSPERFGHRNELPGWLLELVRAADMNDVAETPGGPRSHLMYKEDATAVEAMSTTLLAWARG